MAPAPGSDGLDRLVALGRSPLDRELLDAAIRALDRRYLLASKIVAEPAVAEVVAEFIGRLSDAFGPLAAIRAQRILDVPCGSNSSRSPETGERTAAFEPWMCRLLLELRARPVGIDIGDLEGEVVRASSVDLGVPGALDLLPTASFDAIHESRLFGSPEFRAAHAAATDRVRAEIHRQERRLLRPGGILIHRDRRHG